MDIKYIIVTALNVALTATLLINSVLNLCMKGLLCFCGKWTWASDEERQQMDKRPCYIQSAFFGFTIAAISIIGLIRVETNTDWLRYLEIAAWIPIIVYYGIIGIKGRKK